ncbi:isopenicillin N synthase-like dioxygenase [Caulobacter ginsengisoli]|uniref:2-oxoglutarate-dependent ethylene/succinate-forming enzyme n=1 Tax=Caulobacter ginsengisoli TaxID=400775 RepID=A0ABU0IMR1_9CAUL|nr:2-oxoglutarate and iron-dependent oxygenase domain-containing protein [Caulobacter ginsengisoli]MDQ0463249.1 isopenicillin N synthase-like dioxygenase [Caulobacter ginsengisoli]
MGLPLVDLSKDDSEVAAAVGAACRSHGFFYLVGHGLSDALLDDLEAQSRAFFALPEAEKLQIAMANGGPAWRGFFPVGGELTSGKPDLKEGIYFGEELGPDDPRVKAGWPMHGANQWPAGGLRPAVEAYMAGTTRAAHALTRALAISLGLAPDYFLSRYTAQPTVLFRIFHYPPQPPNADGFGVGEHTDYGFLTLLAQDRHGGLRIKVDGAWLDAPPIQGALVCNVGDMLDRLTRGAYRSAPHRVINSSGQDRLSFPLFFDPGFDAVVEPLSLEAAPRGPRWDEADLDAVTGRYGDYLLGKVGKVFPGLKAQVL